MREPVDDELVARLVAQVERLDGHPLGGDGVRPAVRAGEDPEPARERLERRGPVLLRTEEQSDEVVAGVGHRVSWV